MRQSTIIAYRDDAGNIIQTKLPVCLKDINEFPSPYLEEVFDIKRYNMAGITLARGCPSSCIFCSWGSPKIEGKLRPWSLDRITAELEYLHNAGIRHLHPLDGTFNARPSMIPKLADIIHRKRYSFIWKDVDMRANLTTKEQLDILKNMGVVEVGFGYETCNTETQKLLGKHIDPLRVAQMTRYSNELGFSTHCGMIVGLPGETKEDVLKSARFAIEEIQPEQLGVFPLRIQPGTHLYTNYESYGLSVGMYLSDHGFFSQSDKLPYNTILELSKQITNRVTEITSNVLERRTQFMTNSVFSFSS